MKSTKASVSTWPVFCDLLFNGKGILAFLYARELLQKKSQGEEGVGVDLIVVVDASGSMASAVEQLTTSLVLAVTLMASASPDCRVGLVCYRDGVVHEQPLTPIRTTGGSMEEAAQQVGRMMSKVVTEAGPADLPAGVRRGMELLGEPRPGRRQRLAVLGDVDGREAAKLNGVSHREVERRLIEEFRAWNPLGDRRSLWLWSHATEPPPRLFVRMGIGDGGQTSTNIGELVGWIALTSLKGAR